MPVNPTMSATALTERGESPWSLVEERLENPERPRTYWLATVRPNGAPHLMPVIGMWLDGALHLVIGPGTRKGRNLAAEPRCVIATGSTTLPSLDVILEGTAERVTDADELADLADVYRTKTEWPLEVTDGGVTGPHAPTAGPPPYAIFRITPSAIFGLPGMLGMEQFDPDELPRPTRWDFGRHER
jgi:hypothetical protein